MFKNKFIHVEDMNKRPSDLEIARKGLPANQPTLKERVERDRVHMFYQKDEKHGYWSRWVPGRPSRLLVHVGPWS